MPWLPDRTNPLPLHAQLERHLRDLIATPEYRAGARLPDELSLARDLQVSRNTVRTAIERLVQDGLLVRRRGVGTHVARGTGTTHRTPWDAFLADLEPQGDLIQAVAVAEHPIAAPPPVLRALALAEPTVVVECERLLRTPEGPLARLRTWLHPRLVLDPQERALPLWTRVERAGIVPVTVHEELAAAAADTELARALQVPRGAPLLVRRQIALDGQERPLALSHGWYRGDRVTRSLRLVRDHRG